MNPLHIAASLCIAAKHMHAATPSIMVVRDEIQRAVRRGVRTRMVEELEEATGLPIAELAELTKKWLRKG